jgi:copper(I)-binding protein
MSTPENPSPGSDEPGRGLSGVQRAGIVLGALAILVIVFAVLRSGGEDNGRSPSSSSAQTTSAQSTAPSAQTTNTGESETETENETGSTSTSTSPAPVATIRVVNGQPAGGIKTVSFKKGDQVMLKVQSDVADEIHVHGYDLKKDIAKGGTVQFSFPAKIEGRFEIELEHAGTQIANLEVTPS